MTVLRTGPAVLTANNDFFYLALPVQLTFGYALYESYPLKTELRFKGKVSVTPDWRLKSELYYTGLSDNLADTFKVGPLSLKPKSTVESISQPVQRLLSPIIDAKLNDAVQLRSRITPLWQNAFTPRLVQKEFGVWLKLTPEKVVMTPLSLSNNRMQLSLGIVTGSEVSVGQQPSAAPPRPLPPVQLVSSLDKSFHLQLPTDIFFADLTTALTPVLVDKTFGDDKKITVRSFSMKGEEGRLVVALRSTGAFDGELTVLARPVYNPQSNTLTFEDVDFDTRGAGWLISAGSWLFSSPIRSTIKTKLDAAVADQLEKARTKASSALASVQLADHVSLSCALKSLALGETTVLNDRMSVTVSAQGESTVSLK